MDFTKSLTIGIAYLFWGIVGLFFWIPSIIIETAIYAGALIKASLNNEEISEYDEGSINSAVSLYARGFKILIGFNKYTQMDPEGRPIDNSEDSGNVISRFFGKLIFALIFWAVFGVIFYKINY